MKEGLSMANVIYGGVGAFDAVAYGEQSYGNTLYFQSQVEAARNIVDQFGKQLFSKAEALYERYNGSDAMRTAKAALRAVGGLFLVNKIQPLTTIGNLQQAPIVMQNLIMVNPLVRALYKQQRIDGYSDTYVDPYENIPTHEHPVYQELMNGIVQEDEEGNSFHTTYMLELEDSVRPMTFEDQVDVLTTHDIIEAYIKAGLDDPTSPYNTKL